MMLGCCGLPSWGGVGPVEMQSSGWDGARVLPPPLPPPFGPPPTSTPTTHPTTQTPDTYTLTPAEITAYKRDGYLRLPGFLTDAEVGAIEGAYDKIMRGEVAVPGKDFCDMVCQWVVRCWVVVGWVGLHDDDGDNGASIHPWSVVIG